MRSKAYMLVITNGLKDKVKSRKSRDYSEICRRGWGGVSTSGCSMRWQWFSGCDTPEPPATADAYVGLYCIYVRYVVPLIGGY